MAVTRAQTKASASSSSATSLSVSHPGAPTVGNLQTLCVGSAAAGCAPPDGTWVAAADAAGGVADSTLGTPNTGAQIFYRAVPPGAGAGPYTVTTNGGLTSELVAALDEWTGFAASRFEVQKAANAVSAGSVLTMALNLGTTLAVPELVLMMVMVGGANATSPVASGGLTQDTGLIIFAFDLAIATPTTATGFTAATISWTNTHSTDGAGAVFMSAGPRRSVDRRPVPVARAATR